MLKRILRKGLRVLSQWLYEDNPDEVRDSPVIYPWINAVLLKTLRESPLMRPSYLWGALHGAHLHAPDAGRTDRKRSAVICCCPFCY